MLTIFVILSLRRNKLANVDYKKKKKISVSLLFTCNYTDLLTLKWILLVSSRGFNFIILGCFPSSNVYIFFAAMQEKINKSANVNKKKKRLAVYFCDLLYWNFNVKMKIVGVHF